MINENETYNALCPHSNCCKAHTCQRHIKYQELIPTALSLKVLNPHLTPALLREDENCEHYISCAPISCGKGMLNLLDDMASGKVIAFRNAMLAIFPRNKYFLIRRGEHLCTPDEQETIANLLASIDALPQDYDNNPLSLFDETVNTSPL